jgi:hypothetical protein
MRNYQLLSKDFVPQKLEERRTCGKLKALIKKALINDVSYRKKGEVIIRNLIQILILYAKYVSCLKYFIYFSR